MSARKTSLLRNIAEQIKNGSVDWDDCDVLFHALVENYGAQSAAEELQSAVSHMKRDASPVHRRALEDGLRHLDRATDAFSEIIPDDSGGSDMFAPDDEESARALAAGGAL